MYGRNANNSRGKSAVGEQNMNGNTSNNYGRAGSSSGNAGSCSFLNKPGSSNGVYGGNNLSYQPNSNTMNQLSSANGSSGMYQSQGKFSNGNGNQTGQSSYYNRGPVCQQPNWSYAQPQSMPKMNVSSYQSSSNKPGTPVQSYSSRPQGSTMQQPITYQAPTGTMQPTIMSLQAYNSQMSGMQPRTVGAYQNQNQAMLSGTSGQMIQPQSFTGQMSSSNGMQQNSYSQHSVNGGQMLQGYGQTVSDSQNGYTQQQPQMDNSGYSSLNSARPQTSSYQINPHQPSMSVGNYQNQQQMSIGNYQALNSVRQQQQMAASNLSYQNGGQLSPTSFQMPTSSKPMSYYAPSPSQQQQASTMSNPTMAPAPPNMATSQMSTTSQLNQINLTNQMNQMNTSSKVPSTSMNPMAAPMSTTSQMHTMNRSQYPMQTPNSSSQQLMYGKYGSSQPQQLPSSGNFGQNSQQQSSNQISMSQYQGQQSKQMIPTSYTNNNQIILSGAQTIRAGVPQSGQTIEPQTIRVGAPQPGQTLEPQIIKMQAPQGMMQAYAGDGQGNPGGDAGEEEDSDDEQKVKYIPLSWGELLGGGKDGLNGLKVIMSAPPNPDNPNQNRQLRVAFGNQPVVANPGEVPLKVVSINPVDGYQMGPLEGMESPGAPMLEGDNPSNQQSQLQLQMQPNRTQSLTTPMPISQLQMQQHRSRPSPSHLKVAPPIMTGNPMKTTSSIMHPGNNTTSMVRRSDYAGTKYY